MFWVPQMMPMYWFLICLMVNIFIHFFFSFYYHNVFVFSKFSYSRMKGFEVSFFK